MAHKYGVYDSLNNYKKSCKMTKPKGKEKIVEKIFVEKKVILFSPQANILDFLEISSPKLTHISHMKCSLT